VLVHCNTDHNCRRGKVACETKAHYRIFWDLALTIFIAACLMQCKSTVVPVTLEICLGLVFAISDHG